MPSDNLDNLLKTNDDSNTLPEQSTKYINTKRKVNSICRALSLGTDVYQPQKTVENISSYLSSVNKLDRILYSEISNYVFSLSIDQRGIFATNVEKLLLYSLNEKHNVNDDTRKLIIKIYDHFHLALSQVENVNNILADSIEETKLTLEKEFKGIEREYITILGIFASIVLSFVGGISFSSSIIESMTTPSIFRLVLVIDCLVFLFINLIYILTKFICHINGKDEKNVYNIRTFNICCLAIFALILVCWFFNTDKIKAFISQRYFPWKK
ncbi:hypothetical protein [Ruminococcus sp.]|uniref:hypothetical protein n=1 Tax=Ruminococcus sp. TaxID=41978 RepID=UPI003AB290E5